MGKYFIPLIVLFFSLGACAPAVKPPEIPERYKEKATKEEVFKQAVIGISMIAGGIERSTDLQKGYIKSRPFKPRVEYNFPTLHILEAEIEKKTDPKTGKSYYLPRFRLTAMQAEDARNWKEIYPPESYRVYMESSMQERVIVLISGYLHKFLAPNHYLGFIIVNDREQLYTSPDRSRVFQTAGKFQFGELQFRGFQPVTVYRDGLLQVKFWLKGGEKQVCWVDEDSVNIFMFEVPNIAGTAEVWKDNYKKAFIHAVTRNIGMLKGAEEQWPSAIMHAVMAGTVSEGMTEEQSVAAAGPPDEVETKTDNKGHDLKIYIYRENNVVLKRITFFEGKVAKVFSL